MIPFDFYTKDQDEHHHVVLLSKCRHCGGLREHEIVTLIFDIPIKRKPSWVGIETHAVGMDKNDIYI